MKEVDTNRGYTRKPKKREGYKIESRYCECGCKKSYWHYVKCVEEELNELPADDSHGDLVPLVWLIEKLRKREKCCTMNELIAEAKLNFKGLEHIKHRTINYNH